VAKPEPRLFLEPNYKEEKFMLNINSEKITWN
jgi:hypothetical protein